MIQRRVTVLCLMSWSPRVAHAQNARIPRLNELRARALFVTVDYQSVVSEYGDFKSPSMLPRIRVSEITEKHNDYDNHCTTPITC